VLAVRHVCSPLQLAVALVRKPHVLELQRSNIETECGLAIVHAVYAVTAEF